MTTYTTEEWRAEGKRLFGPDMKQWKFKCPSCGHVQSVKDYMDAGAPEGAVGFSCVGRWTGAKREMLGEGEGPCNYAGGGLIGLNPVIVTDGDNEHRVFEFSEANSNAH